MTTHTVAPHPLEVTDETFDQEVLASDVPVLVDFGARWCGPCKALAPIVHRVAHETLGRAKVVTMDTDDSPQTAARYGIRGVPTLLVFRRGEKTAQHVGTTTREKLLAMLA
jgi:thioredoxin 1